MLLWEDVVLQPVCYTSLKTLSVIHCNIGKSKKEVAVLCSKGSSREARSLAENAFFHPSMMSVSYFSYEHCFVVYSVRFVVYYSYHNS